MSLRMFVQKDNVSKQIDCEYHSLEHPKFQLDFFYYMGSDHKIVVLDEQKYHCFDWKFPVKRQFNQMESIDFYAGKSFRFLGYPIVLNYIYIRKESIQNILFSKYTLIFNETYDYLLKALKENHNLKQRYNLTQKICSNVFFATETDTKRSLKNNIKVLVFPMSCIQEMLLKYPFKDDIGIQKVSPFWKIDYVEDGNGFKIYRAKEIVERDLKKQEFENVRKYGLFDLKNVKNVEQARQIDGCKELIAADDLDIKAIEISFKKIT